MGKLFTSAIAILFAATSCKKQIESQEQTAGQSKEQITASCGTDISKISPSGRARLRESNMGTTFPASETLLYLDFDGAMVRPGFGGVGYSSGTGQTSLYTSAIVNSLRSLPAAPLTPEQINQIVALVADDFSPFNIRITTDLSEYASYPRNLRQLHIITTFPNVVGLPFGIGGISPFTLDFIANQPSFSFASVFIDPNIGIFGGSLEWLASTISHEVGHSIGLDHQPQLVSLPTNPCSFAFEYNRGYGSGPLGFAPIMGFGDKRVNNWFAQCRGGNFRPSAQDDYEFISSRIQVRSDDFPNTLGPGSVITSNEITGILEGNKATGNPDVDFIKFNVRNPGPINISVTSENIDIKASLYQGGRLIGEYNDPDDTHVQINAPKAAGMLFLKIEGASNINMDQRFMTGQYKVTLN